LEAEGIELAKQANNHAEMANHHAEKANHHAEKADQRSKESNRIAYIALALTAVALLLTVPGVVVGMKYCRHSASEIPPTASPIVVGHPVHMSCSGSDRV